MNSMGKKGYRVIAGLMFFAALVLGGVVVWQASQMDDGGPAMGALCTALPSVGLLIGGGVVWTASKKLS